MFVRMQLYQKGVQWFGGFGEGPGQFRCPSAVAYDPNNDRIIVADSENCRIQVFDRDGGYLAQFGSLGPPHSRLNFPSGVVVDPRNSHIVVADSWNSRVVTFDENGRFLTSLGKGGRGDPEVQLPLAVAVNPVNGQYLVADCLNHCVRVYDAAGEFVRTFGPGQLYHPRGIALLSNGDIVVSDRRSTLHMFDQEGKLLRVATSLNNPEHLCVDTQNRIFVANRYSHEVKVFDRTLEPVTAIRVEELLNPGGVCVDPKGRVIISEWGDGNYDVDLEGQWTIAFLTRVKNEHRISILELP